MRSQKENQTSEELVPSLRDSIKDIGMDIVELGVDAIINEGIFSEVPIVDIPLT